MLKDMVIEGKRITLKKFLKKHKIFKMNKYVKK